MAPTALAWGLETVWAMARCSVLVPEQAVWVQTRLARGQVSVSALDPALTLVPGKI